MAIKKETKVPKEKKEKVEKVKAEIVTTDVAVVVEEKQELQLPPHVESIPGLDLTFAKRVLAGFEQFFDQAAMYEAEAREIIVTSPQDIAMISKAREMRLAMVKIRTSAEKAKDASKQPLLIQTRFIDSIFNAVKMVTLPIEQHLDKQEKFVAMEIARIKKEVTEKRLAILEPYNVDTSYLSLADMPEEAFERLVADSKLIHENKIKAQKEADEKAEKERIDLAKQKEEQDKKDAEQAEIDKVQKAKQAELDKETERIAKEKEAIEKAKAKEEQDKKDNEERERLERQKAQQAPDKEKLLKFEEELSQLKTSINLDVTTEKGIAIATGIQTMLLKMSDYITNNANKL